MRNHVIDCITEMAKTNDRIYVVTADLGYNVLDDFRVKYPDRFVNVGIAEQNMTSVAAGMALEDNMVFTYSIGNFPTLRCIEQIRNDVCYHNANVKVLSVGGGFAYGDLGMSHHATEDIAMMRALPNMRVYVPADVCEAHVCLKDACSFIGPAFIRMARGREPLQHKKEDILDVSQLIYMTERYEDVTILTTGTILSEAMQVKILLQEDGVNVSVAAVPRVKPIDTEGIREVAKRSKIIVTMEDHNITAGFGSAVAEVLSEMEAAHALLMRVGLPDVYTSIVGDQEYIRDYYGLSARKVRARILNCLEKL